MNDGILVTGATGFIGTHLVAALRTSGYRVLTHCRRDGDIADSSLLDYDVRHVFHLAGKSFVPDSWKDPQSFYKVNVLGTVNVLELCRRRRASLTFLSSYVYGTPEALPVAESHPVRPFNPYSHSKIVAEEICRYFAESFQIPVTIVRPFNVYGPGQADHFLIAKLLKQAVSPDCPVFSVDDIRPRRDHLYIDDLIELLIILMDRGALGTFNAGSGHSVSIEEIVREINSLLPEPKALVSGNRVRTDEILDVVADISKAHRETGWRPTVALRTGLARALECMAAGVA